MQLTPDIPIGQPSFQLSKDQIATVIDLLCRAATAGRDEVITGMLEVPMTIIVRKALRNVKKSLGLTNLQVRGEHELGNMAKADASLLGRIDITLRFLHQFGNEDAYVAVECKRVGAGKPGLNTRYVTEGVSRFASGKYSANHEWGFMLGYVLVLPAGGIVASVDRRIRKKYGEVAKLDSLPGHLDALAIFTGPIKQPGGHIIKLNHIFVDMVTAA